VSVPVHALTPKAQIAIVELHQEYQRKLHYADFVTPPRGYFGQLSREYEAKLKEIVREGMREVSNDRYVRVKCPGCGRQSTIAGDVASRHCVCSPQTERYTFQTREAS
jgi:hypothetical protein